MALADLQTGVTIDRKSPVTIKNCQLGRNIELKVYGFVPGKKKKKKEEEPHLIRI